MDGHQGARDASVHPSRGDGMKAAAGLALIHNNLRYACSGFGLLDGSPL